MVSAKRKRRMTTPNQSELPAGATEPDTLDVLALEFDRLSRMIADDAFGREVAKPYGGIGEVRGAVFLAQRVILAACALGEQIRELRQVIEEGQSLALATRLPRANVVVGVDER